MDSSQDHGAALHGSSSCQVRCCTVQRPRCALLSATDYPRRTGVERSTSSTSSFIASTGTAAACRRPPAQLRRRADATADHMGPVAVQADLVVPPVSFVGPCVCGYRAFFFHFIDEYMKTRAHEKPCTCKGCTEHAKYLKQGTLGAAVCASKSEAQLDAPPPQQRMRRLPCLPRDSSRDSSRDHTRDHTHHAHTRGHTALRTISRPPMRRV